MGFSGFWIARALRQLNINTIIVNPADIPTSNKEKDRKSDTIDSNKLARELENNNISPVYIPDINIQHLRSLSHLYHKTVNFHGKVTQYFHEN
jgi:transposase